MNRREETLTNRTRKKMVKEIRSAEKKTRGSSQPSTRNLRGQNLAKRPRKVVRREQGELATLKKNLTIKRGKKAAKHSKRTTPGLVESTSSPRHPHIEGERWMKTVQKQSLSRAQKMGSKLRKQTKKR